MSRSKSYIDISDLVVSFPVGLGEIRAVDGVDLTIAKGEILGLIGESGSGKSTLGWSILNMIPPPGRIVSGTIKVGPSVVNSLSRNALREYRWREVAMVFQSAMNALDPVQTVGSQMVETIRQHSKETKGKALERSMALLSAVKLSPSHLSAYPHELSGGMRQRAMIALSLCLNPNVLIADEPTTGLDVVVQGGILRMLRDLREKLGLTIILISHDVSIMGAVCDRIAVMYAGKLVEVGDAAQVVGSPSHPYTEALLHSVVEIGFNSSAVSGIPGTPPNRLHMPKGCPFQPRCKYAFEKCLESDPPLVAHDKLEVACWAREGLS